MLLLFACILGSLVSSSWCQDPLVKTKQGLVRGTRVTGAGYSEFLGIPYAVVDPDNPFGESLPHPPFDTIFEAHDESPACPQMTHQGSQVEGSLDCLSLNVFVPSSASSTNKLPVMFWMYGGRFEFGSASQHTFGPQYLMKDDVILITVNYRLGVYGFMCLDIPSVPGNSGLKDQRNALRWVNENIEYFGGDASNVTIFGQSAGSGSVHYHILSNNSAGLFNKAILQSATAFTNGMIEKSNPTASLDIAKHLGFNAISIEESLEFLKNISITELTIAVNDLKLEFRPCIEKQFDNVKSILHASPQKILESGDYKSVPIMIGHTHTEDFFLINSFDEGKSYSSVILDTLSPRFNFENALQLQTALRIVEDFYIGHRNITKDDAFAIINFYSDLHNHGIDRTVKYQLANSKDPVYQYVFAYVSKQDNENYIIQASHTDDVGYIFKDQDSEVTARDQLVIDIMTAMWTNFAKYGNPTPAVSDQLPVIWPAATEDSRDYLLIDYELSVHQKVFHERIAFWDLFYVAYGKYHWLA